MGGRITHHAEVRAAANDAPAEVVLPDAVGHHAGRKRIVGRDEPASQRRAAAGGLRIRGRRGDHRLLRLEDRRKRRAHLVFRLLLRMRIAAVKDERVGRRGPAFGHDERLVNGHLFLLESLQCLRLRVVVLLPVAAQDAFAISGDGLLQVGVFSCRLPTGRGSRERPCREPRPRPRHGQPLAVLSLEVVEPDRQTARFHWHGGGLRLPFAVDAVVFDDLTAIDSQPRAVVGVEREGVIAIRRHLEQAREHIAEGVGPQGWRDRDIEELTGHGPRVFSLQVIENRQPRPRIAVKPKFKIVEVATDGIGLVERLPRRAKFLLDLRDGHLRLIASAF